MNFRKKNVKEQEAIVYIDCFGRKTEYREGDYTIYDNKPITRELIEDHYRAENRFVENAIRNNRPPVSKKEKEQIKEWKRTHPGEDVPKNWHFKLDQFFGDEDSDMDRSSVMGKLVTLMDASIPMEDILYEVMDEMPEKHRICLIKVILEGYTMQEVAEELNCDTSTVSRRIKKAINYIRQCEERFNFR